MKSFLEKALKGKEYKKTSLTLEGSDRQYFRVTTKKDSYILACSPIEQQEKFLQRWKDFSQWGLNVPKLYFCQPNLDSKSTNQKRFLLLEDLGDQSLEKKVLESNTFPLSYYFQALDQIMKLSCQLGFVGENFLKEKGENRKTVRQNQGNIFPFFTKEQFFKEMLWTEQYLINDFYKFKPEKKFQIKYLKEWDHICRTLSSFPFLPAHRDYHSRNIFIKDKKTYIIDFQDAGFFPRFYDVVSLLYDVYVHSRMTSKRRERLLQYFIVHHLSLKLTGFSDHLTREEIQKEGRPSQQKNIKNFFTEQEILEKIRWEIAITTVQRLFKACGSFAGFYSLKKQSTHLKYIVPALKILRAELQEIKQYPYFLSLIELLLKKKEKMSEGGRDDGINSV